TYGGAIFINGKNTNIINSNVSESHASANAGGVYLGPHTYVFNSTFNENFAQRGGAMYNAGGTAIVSYSNFTNNTADSNNPRGGAIYWEGGSSNDVIIHCYFENNKAVNLADASMHTGYGGAIYWSMGSAVASNSIIKDSTFYNNYAQRHGGAIDWFRSDDGTIDNCNFIENKAERDGGAIYAGDDSSDGKNLTISNCNFTRNIAYEHGGALSEQFASSHIINVTFDSNSAVQGGTIYMANKKANHTEFVNCSFINSSTKSSKPSHAGNGAGGAAYIVSPYVNFINCNFTNVTVLKDKNGGAIYLDSSAVNGIIENCTFTNTSGACDGGAIFIKADNINVKNSTFILNSAHNGGAICINSMNNNIENSTFEDNYVIYANVNTERGGAIYINNADNVKSFNNTIFNSTFRNNTARYGGAIYINTKNNTITDSTFDNNTARNGGAIYVAHENNTISNSTLKYNKASENGGAIYIAADNVNITDSSSIFGNFAKYGGAIYLSDAKNILIELTKITDNNATNGSAIYAKGSTYKLNSVVLLDNQAHAYKFINKTFGVNDDGKYYVSGVFLANDNLLNAIWNDANSEAVSFNNVTYWGVNGKNVTNNVPELSTAEVWQNITVERLSSDGESISNATVITDGNGVFKYYFDDDEDSKASFNFYHFEDKYYKALTDTASIKKSKVNISVADIDFGENATVKINLTDWDGNKLTANVTIRINNTHNFTMKIVNGVGEVNNVSGLIAGIHNATVIFKGNETIMGSSNSTLFTVKPAVNIIINKTSDIVGNASVYDLANYTIIVTNNGPSNATGVNITDYLEEGLVYIDAGSNLSSVTKEKITLPNGTEVVKWTIGNLTKNVSVKLWVQVNLTRNGTFGNVAIVDSVEGGRNSSNVTNITVNPVVNLTVVKVSNLTGNVSVGDLVNYTITVTNNGPSNATMVNITDVLDSSFEFVNASGGVRPVGGVIRWDVGKIVNGTFVTVWVQVRVKMNGTFTNVATAVAKENKTSFENGTNITVDPVVNLTVVKSSDVVGNVSVGDLVNYTITVTNNGPSNATMVNV
ncbi:MAG: DUF11 domain-containing protein, partial [Methanobrevibacter sp.]|nr:DUF11 domain-containing protein [Methanobrevibacter sp.]